MTDFIIVLRNKDAIKTFSGDAHLSVGAGCSAAAGTIGRAVEADLRAGDGGYAACYTYSCSKGISCPNISVFLMFLYCNSALFRRLEPFSIRKIKNENFRLYLDVFLLLCHKTCLLWSN